MTDESTPATGAVAPEAPAPAPDLNLAVTVPHSAATEGGEDRSITVALGDIPAEARLELLRSAVRGFVYNRVNVANVRQNKLIAPWIAYEAAIAADPLQTAVAKPDGERPAPLDTFAKAEESIAALLKGELGTRKGEGTGKSRAPKDPLVSAVTPIVVRAVFDSRKAAGATVPVEGKAPRMYTYPDAVKEVGGNGVAYLNAQIDAKVAAVPEAEQAALRKQLEQHRDTRYIEPAKVMIGQTVTKKAGELPSIL